MAYYVVYGKDQIVRGPISRELALATVEDLDIAFEDTGYHVVDEVDLVDMGLLAPEAARAE